MRVPPRTHAPVAHHFRWLALALAVPALPHVLEARAEIDVVVMKNGDRITCEIKRLEKGQLFLKATYTKAEFAVDWNMVERIDSEQPFILQMTKGELLTGGLRKRSDETGAAPEGTLEVTRPTGDLAVEQKKIVDIRPYGVGFVQKLDGSVDFGFGLTKANNQTQSSLHFDIQYRDRRDLLSFNVDSLFSHTEGAPDTNRHELTTVYDRTFRERWFSRAFSGFLTSDEQDLALRTTLGGALGRKLLYTNRRMVSAFAGGLWNNERYRSTGTTRDSAEAAAGVEFEAFLFDISEFTASAVAFPSMSEGGRFRVNLNVEWSQKIVGNLRYRLSAFENFDNRPPEGTSHHDYGVSSGLKWTF